MNVELSQIMDLLNSNVSLGSAAMGLAGLFLGWKATKYAVGKTLGGVASIMGSSFKAANASPAALIMLGGTSVGASFDGVLGGGNCYTMLGLGISSVVIGFAQYMIKADRGDYNNKA